MTGQWEVVKHTKRAEYVLHGPLTYSEAYALYEKEAKQINARDKDGNYLNPDVRVVIREVRS